MEREVGEVRGRRGGEMRGIIVGGITLLLLFGCNNGIAELEKEKESILSISKLRQGFLDAFVSFGGDLLKESFGITKDTTKQKVGEDLDKVGEAVKTVKGKLESIKKDSNYDLIKDKADSIITKAINTLSKIVEGTNKIKEATALANDEKIASATGDTEVAAPANDKSVQGIVEGISKICEAAREYGTDSKGDNNKTIENSAKIAKLFNTNTEANDAAALPGANRAVIAASGADILAAIEAVNGKKTDAGNIQNAQNAYDIAIAQKNDTDISGNVKTNVSAIAAGLALRAMAKDGKYYSC